MLVLLMLIASGCTATSVHNGPTDSVTSTGRPESTSESGLPVPRRDGPGVTATTITVENPVQGEPAPYPKLANAIAAAYSARGGLAGRRIVFVNPKTANIPANATVQQATAAKCAAFSNGPKYFINLGPGLSCQGQAGVVSVDDSTSNDYGISSTYLADDPYIVAPSNMSATRMARTLALRLGADGVLSKAHTVGVLTDPADAQYDGQQAVTALLDALRHGNPKYQVQTFPLAEVTTAASINQVIKLKQAGVDTVIPATNIEEENLLLPLFAQQHYYPTVAGIGVALDANYSLKGVPASMLAKIVSYSWRPADVFIPAGQADQLARAQPGAADCLKIVQDAHIGIGHDTLEPALQMCQDFGLVKAALAASGSKYVNAQAFMNGYAKIRGFQCLLAFSCTLSATQRDGVTAIRKITYDARTKAFRYSGGNLSTAPG